MQLFGLTRGYRFDPARRFALGLLARNGAAILAVPRLNLLARPVAATKVGGSAGRARSAVSFQRSAFGVIFVTSPSFAEKLQTKTLCSPHLLQH